MSYCMSIDVSGDTNVPVCRLTYCMSKSIEIQACNTMSIDVLLSKKISNDQELI